MASEYLMKKYKDVKPDAPKPMTPKEKRKNWWYYHRIHFVIGAVVLVFVIGFIHDVLMKEEPDYQIALVGDFNLDEDTKQAVQLRLEELGEDVNGDGKVLVQVNSYYKNEEDPMAYAVQVSLMGDISVGVSDFFLVDDPVAFQRDYGVLTMSDGSLFDDGMNAEQCVRYAWQDCPALSDIDLDGKFYLARREYTDEEKREEHACADGLWQAMTAGAEPE